MQDPNSPDPLTLHLARVPLHRALIRTLEHQLFNQVTLVEPVLDIGCGDGHYAAATFPGGLSAGVDVTFEIVRSAQEHGPYRSLAVADGTRLPYRDESFGSVISNCVIEHIPDIDGVVCEAARVLKPDGRFVFSVPNEHFTESLPTVRMLRDLKLNGLAERYGVWWNKRAIHHHMDSLATWEARLARCGLSIESHVEYMSVSATRVFEYSHYYAAPSIVWHRLTGNWSLRPERVRSTFAYRWLLPHTQETDVPVGANTFYITRKMR